MEKLLDHQKTFSFSKVTISSNFPSGNLSKCQQLQPNTYNLWIGNDPKSTYRTWFYFSIQGVQKKTTCTFTIKNMSNQAKIYKEGLVPVFREEKSKEWQRIKIPIQVASINYGSQGLEFQWKYYFESEEKVYFAFSFPWELEEWQGLVGELKEFCESKKERYFQRSILTHSLQNRPVQVITITNLSKQDKEKQGQGRQQKQQQSQSQKIISIPQNIFRENPPALFPKKNGLFISARVHPGQVPSSHIFNGIIKQLMTQTQQISVLLQNCVLYLIPFLNPDGVYNGFYRSNTQGQNLNRHYLIPCQKQHPQIFHTKKLIEYLAKNTQLKCCLDLHAHAAKKGCFIYGNSVPDLKKQVEICLFPKLLSLNNEDFDYDGCNFTEANMYQTDKGDNLSKEGAARVGLYKATNLHTCWTLEVNYNTGKTKNKLFNKAHISEKFNVNSIKKGIVFDYFGEENIVNEGFYNIKSFENMGKSIVESFVDYFELSSVSRVNSSPYKNIRTLKLNLSVSILRMIPFKFDQNMRRLFQKLLIEQSVFESLKRVHSIIDDPKKEILCNRRASSEIPKIGNQINKEKQKQKEKEKQKERQIIKSRKPSVNKLVPNKNISRKQSTDKLISKPFK